MDAKHYCTLSMGTTMLIETGHCKPYTNACEGCNSGLDVLGLHDTLQLTLSHGACHVDMWRPASIDSTSCSCHKEHTADRSVC